MSVELSDFDNMFTSDWAPNSRLLAARAAALNSAGKTALSPYGVPAEEVNYWMINLLDQQGAALQTALKPLKSRSTWEQLSKMTLLEVILYLTPKGVVTPDRTVHLPPAE